MSAQQVADSGFSPPIHHPAFDAGRGPVVLIDEAHLNFHTAGGRYYTFAKLLRADGYVVRPSQSRFARQMLAGADILVISNAIAEQNEEDWSLPTPSAFDSAEIAAVRQWVQQGGALLLIADHMPFPGAAAELAAAFGVLFNNGFAMGQEQSGEMVFRRSDGSLADHPVTNGRGPGERVDSVVAFTGQAFRAVAQIDSLLILGLDVVLLMPQQAWRFSKSTPRLSAAHWLQGAVLRVGQGRVAVFGEAAMFSAQLAGPDRTPLGMNSPHAVQNAQFLLNVVHWLSGLLDQR
ncbi:MAG: DUF4350 domain-containing protein [Gemmatimonadales bacterium]|nr:DUF4350 domain-containing protein [Gemmatimonadales bacterium]NIN10259.1 DUF4350 domain-containing protein [Gemmatimonadales bacterium]NIN49055.1 DUF4350 domain-containing protein [Gemmatimonadales bacterium]NIP06519.1 DUF4350 domain-containing protein [Gemmatimonadales bacterium]NIQ98862.1 DUF4350 domain-containing protein [Gemmatimonadales bacterium]